MAGTQAECPSCSQVVTVPHPLPVSAAQEAAGTVTLSDADLAEPPSARGESRRKRVLLLPLGIAAALVLAAGAVFFSLKHVSRDRSGLPPDRTEGTTASDRPVPATTDPAAIAHGPPARAATNSLTDVQPRKDRQEAVDLPTLPAVNISELKRLLRRQQTTGQTNGMERCLQLLDELEHGSPAGLMQALDEAETDRARAKVCERLAWWYLRHDHIGEAVLAAAWGASYADDEVRSSLFQEIRRLKQTRVNKAIVDLLLAAASQKAGNEAEEETKISHVLQVDTFEVEDEEFVNKARAHFRPMIQVEKLGNDKAMPSFIWKKEATIASVCLSIFPDPADVSVLVPIMATDPFDSTSVTMLRALVRRDPLPVYGLLHHAIPNVRANAAFALSAAPKADAVEKLIQMEQVETRDEPRIGIWETLAGFGYEDRAEKLVALTTNSSHLVRINALYALKRMNHAVESEILRAAAEPSALWGSRVCVLVQLDQAFALLTTNDFDLVDTALLKAALSNFRSRPLDKADVEWMGDLVAKQADMYGSGGGYDSKTNKWGSSVNTKPWLDEHGFVIGANHWPAYDEVRSDVAVVLAERGRPHIDSLKEWGKGECPYRRRAATVALGAMADNDDAKGVLIHIAKGKFDAQHDREVVGNAFTARIKELEPKLNGFMGSISINYDGIEASARRIGSNYVSQTRSQAIRALAGRLSSDSLQEIAPLIVEPALSRAVVQVCIRSGNKTCLEWMPSSLDQIEDPQARIAVAAVWHLFGREAEALPVFREALRAEDEDTVKKALLVLYESPISGLDGDLLALAERPKTDSFLAHLARWLLIRREM